MAAPLPIPIAWTPREPPLTAVAVAARGAAASCLARKLIAAAEDRLAGLSGVAAKGLILIFGASDALPWVDGALYLGRDPRAPSLLLPATRAPTIHPELLESAVLRDRHATGGSLALLLDPPAAVSTAALLPISKAQLAIWLEDQETGQ
jgi:hypothetical protein